MLDLTHFTLRDATELGAVLRRLGSGAESMEEVAHRIVRHLREALLDPTTGGPACPLVRFFKTHRCLDLEPELLAFARARMGGESPKPSMRCLTLLATAGARSEWNARTASVDHQAIPLASKEMVAQAPMISSLLRQLGVDVGELVSSRPDLLVDPQPVSFNVFYVPEARGSAVLPGQEGFVVPARIRSVLGFGGWLPGGEIFVVILFSRVPIPRETAELFRTQALNVKHAVLPFEERVFAQAPLPAARSAGAERRSLSARIQTLEQLLEVYERSVLEQSDRLYAEQEQLRFQSTLLECQGEAALDGILSVAADGTILFSNRRLARMWRIPAPRVKTKSYARVLDAMARQTTDPDGFLARSAQLWEGAEGRDEVRLRDGRTFDRHTAPIRRPDKEFLGRVWHFRDITSSKEVARLKDEFISAVSHELRTPLTSIRGALDLIGGGVAGELPPDAARLAEVARTNCERLTRLVDDVLDLEKIEAGHMDFRLEVRELTPLVEQALESMRPYGDGFGVAFGLERSVSGARVQVDADRLMQVLQNLLSNAARFSPRDGTVHVGVERRRAHLRVSVADDGPGIPVEFQDRVFERFASGGAPDERRKGGTGLGLAIARAIVERLGGQIGFHSAPGVGTRFYFDLPECRLEHENAWPSPRS